MKTFFKENKNGLIGTIIFHGIVLLLLMLFGLKAPYISPAEECLLINFGFDETGFGQTGPSNLNKTETVKDKTEEIEKVKDKTKDKFLTQDIEEAPVIKDGTQKDKTQEPKINLDALYKGKKGRSEDGSSNEGIKGRSDNEGRPEGSVVSKNYSEGSGDGFGWSLEGSGRKLIMPPAITADFQQEGIVVVDIKVDKYGNVISAIPVLKGSTTTSIYLQKLAKDAVMEMKFNQKFDALEVQKGTVIFHFKIRE